MDKKHKKSRAFLTTIIILLLILLGLYLLYQNKDSGSSSSLLNKIFSSLNTSENGSEIEVVQAGENIEKGDSVSVLTDTGGDTVVVKTTGNSAVYGTAYEDIDEGDVGKIVKKTNKNINKFLESISDFLDNLISDKTDEVNNIIDNENSSSSSKTIIPTVTVTASPSSISSGDSSTISWTSTNAVSCDAGDDSRGTGASGSFSTGILSTTTSYAVTCKAKNGNVMSDMVIVLVTNSYGSGDNGSSDPDSNNGPDLTAGSVSPITVTAGTIQSFSAIASNTGNENAEGFIATMYYSDKYDGKGTITEINNQDVQSLATKKNETIVGAHKFSSTDETPSIRVCADTNNEVNETNEDNNCGDWINIIVTNSSGLNIPTVTVTASPNSISSGGSSTISWTSTNATSCDAGDDSRGTGTSGSFSTGELTTSRSYSVKCKSSSGMPGIGNTIVYVDINVSTSSGPDLIAYPITTTTAIIETAQEFSVEIQNIGNKSTEDEFDNILEYATESNGRGILTKDSVILTLGPLDSNDNTTATWTHTFTEGGTYYMRMCTDKSYIDDTDGLIDETNEDNNCGAWMAIVVSDSDSLPTETSDSDLIAYSVTPTSVTANNIEAFSAIIENQGSSSTGDEFPYFFQISENSTGTDATDLEYDTLTAIDSGNVKTASQKNVFTSSGTYYMRVCADKYSSTEDGVINETDEDNNCGDWTTISVSSSSDSSDMCSLIDSNPLTFTDAEQAKLEELLRKYYLIISTLKNDGDISSIYTDMTNYETEIESANELIEQCYAETNDQTNYEDFANRNTNLDLPSWNSNIYVNTDYAGPKRRGGNPWYKYSVRPSYIYSTKPTIKESGINIDESDNTKLFSAYYYCYMITDLSTDLGSRAPSSNIDCSSVEDRLQYDYEKLFNIW